MYKAVFFFALIISGSIVANMLSQDQPKISTNESLSSLAVQPHPQEKDQEQEKDKPKKRIVIPADDDKANERRDFMRIKMQSSQYILEGLTVKNFKLVNKGIQQIKDMTQSSKWVAIDDPIYRDLVKDFETATERLEAAAKTQNIDATAMRYYQLTTNCIDCHKQIHKAEYSF